MDRGHLGIAGVILRKPGMYHGELLNPMPDEAGLSQGQWSLMCWSELQNDHFKSGCFVVVVGFSSVA